LSDSIQLVLQKNFDLYQKNFLACRFGANTYSNLMNTRNSVCAFLKLRCDERFTHGFTALLHVVAFSKKLRWLTQTKVISLKTQLHAVSACVKLSSQRSFKLKSQKQAIKYVI